MTDHLPNNPMMMVSSINMMLRDDEFESLESLCAYYDRDISELLSTLEQAGFTYLAEIRQFR